MLLDCGSADAGWGGDEPKKLKLAGREKEKVGGEKRGGEGKERGGEGTAGLRPACQQV